jgi:hypothetical protein
MLDPRGLDEVSTLPRSAPHGRSPVIALLPHILSPVHRPPPSIAESGTTTHPLELHIYAEMIHPTCILALHLCDAYDEEYTCKILHQTIPSCQVSNQASLSFPGFRGCYTRDQNSEMMISKILKIIMYIYTVYNRHIKVLIIN